MATISTVAVDFIANTGKYTTGLDGMAKKTKAWSDKTKGEAKGVTAAFDNTTKSITNLAKGLVGLVAIQRVGAAFTNAAKQVSLLADEAEKVGASAEQFDKLRLAAERNGSDIGTVKIAYKELQKSINEATSGTKETVKAFDDLGLSYSYINRISPDKRFLAVADALSKIEDANKRAEIGTRLLGKSFTELSPLIAKGAAGIEREGRGGLNATEIQSIDKGTKSVEELSRVLNNELKKVIADLSPTIQSLAKGLSTAAKNIEVLKNLLGIAGLLGAIIAVNKAFVIFSGILNFEIARGTALLLANTGAMTASFTSLLAIVSRLSILNGYFIAVGAAASAVATKLAVLTAGVLSLKVAVIALLTTLALIPIAFEVVTRVVEKGARVLGFEGYADGLKFIREQVEEFILGLFGAETEADRAATLVKDSLLLIEKAQENLKNITENQFGTIEDIIKQFSDEAEKSFQKVIQANIDLANSLNEKFKSPFDSAVEQFKNLTLAVDTGKITIDTYKKAVAELVKGLDTVDLYKFRTAFGVGPFEALAAPLTNLAGPNDPRGLLGSTKTPIESFAPDFSKGSSLALVNLANINSAVGGVADSYNTAGENALKFTIAADKAFSDSKLQTFSAVKSDLDALAFVDLAKKLQDSIGGPSAKEVFDQQVANINMAAMAVDEYGNSILSAAAKTLALDNATEQYGIASAEAFRKSNEEMFNIVMLTEDFASSLGTAIAAGQSFGEALKNVFQDLTKQIIAMIIRSIILQSILQAIGVVTGGVSSVAATAFASMMNIKPMAAGGPVKGGTPYQVGELGPELFVPEGNGYIVPNNMMGGGGTVVNQTINVQTGVAQTVRAEMLALLPQFRTQAVNAVLETKQRGGSFSKGMAFA